MVLRETGIQAERLREGDPGWLRITGGLPGGDATEDGIEVVAAEREEDSGGGCPQVGGMEVALAVRVDEVADFGQQLFYQHCLIKTQAILGLLKRRERE